MSENKNNKNSSWIELCSWVEKNIFNYDNNQKLQKKSILILRGLEKGQNVRNNNCEEYGNYSHEVILMTFKANKDKILRSVIGKDFASESNKMSYVCAIVRNNINDMYTRMKNAEKAQEKVEKIDVSVMTYEGAEYKSQTETASINNDKFKDLW